VFEAKVVHSLADHGLKFAPDAATKARFEKLKALLLAAPPARPETTPLPAKARP
jgi:hypothetical protein